ncbi:oligosaccharide flippase family protein [Aromatoleum buckelii]|uniref:Oligosaccharide flippase family protein n=1 Tax=Aromatoleum buckelii TaxID=200254 RepID=A0ABX1N5R2_9RHOO|nr:oligosaccharide flippase family protein [Aromatoleum buckelii]MCK0512712.1 oligosaccharide flippase family protein [Aromatoleum buckelii]
MKLKGNLINGLSLITIQGANALFPLLVFPFLLSVLGEGAFAELVVAESLALYVLTVSLYSFDTSGVQYIIEARKGGKLAKEADFFMNILAARIVLFLVSSLLLATLFGIFSDSSLNVLLAWLGFALGTVLQSNYYFQAIENNYELAFFILLSRFCGVLAAYLFINSPDDLLRASAILSGSFLVSGLAVLVVAINRFGLDSWRLVSTKKIVSLLRNGRHLFLGNISVLLFRNTNILILAGVSSSTSVSTYALAEKIIKSIQALARPLNQLFMPKAVKGWSAQPVDKRTSITALALIWKNTRTQVYLLLAVLPAIVLSIYVGHALGFLPGFSDDVIALVTLMAPSVIFGAANAMFGVVGLSLIGAQSYFSAVVFIVGVATFLYSLIASYAFSAYGAATAYIFAEVLLLILFIWKYHRNTTRGHFSS